ncbi:NYN domain-containing protein [Hymenobacter sp. ASUV-10]|uniref:NYN domain-containing protein n=1 Tax=Hymenobacter aranciens TaxID=3063996 RepID=A0ABT9BJG8_9BACT|nr:NYN domain-containing protein [Hymenobacter sp. ASUV-10]MDO7877152.1 NYN domain-containing protein [Hymenobacter sp. ASUV-10]
MSNKTAASPYAAVFIDFENVYYFLKNHFHDPPDLNDYTLELVRKLRERLAEQGNDCLVMNAYADFERMPSAPQGALYLVGVSTRNVLGTDHKNAADMQLCIDALEILYTRKDIGTFVLLGGDRDYIPMLQHLRRQARQVIVAGFREATSGDLLQNLLPQHFFDARDLLSEETVTALEQRRLDRAKQLEDSRRLREHGMAGAPNPIALALRASQAAAAATDENGETTEDENGEAREPGPVNTAPPGYPPLTSSIVNTISSTPRPYVPTMASNRPITTPDEPVPFAPPKRLIREHEHRVLELMLGEFSKLELKQQRRVSELWLGPFMRLLTDALPELPDWERRDLINKLRDAGAIRIEKREGEPHPFSVIVVNYNHPDVWEMHPGGE